MNSLLGRLVDSSHVVRKFCIRGLGNISSVEESQVMYMHTLENIVKLLSSVPGNGHTTWLDPQTKKLKL